MVSLQTSRRVQPRRRGPRRLRNLVVAVVVIVAVLVGADFAARQVAENVLAGKIEQQGLPRKPDVSIEGFPFLTQAASKHFSDVVIRATDLPEGPLTISTLDATASDVRTSSYAFSSGTIGRVDGTVLISFASLGNTLAKEIGPLGTILRGAGLQLSAAGPDEVRASLNLIVASGSATWRISLLSTNELSIRLVGSSGLPQSLLDSISGVTLHIPRLPLGLTIDRVRVSTAGVVGTISAANVRFGS